MCVAWCECLRLFLLRVIVGVCVFGLMLWLFKVLGDFLVKTHLLMFTFACLLLFVCGLCLFCVLRVFVRVVVVCVFLCVNLV